MAKKKQEKTSGFPPQTRQRRFEHPGIDTSLSTAIPRDTEFDLQPQYSRTRFTTDEQTFRVTKKGNCP